jgi:hypothetical protein
MEFKQIIIMSFGLMSLGLGLWASYLMYNVAAGDTISWIAAQRIWTKALLMIIIYLLIYIWLNKNGDITRTNTIFSLGILSLNAGYAVFLLFIAISVVLMPLFWGEGATISTMLPNYYWFCVTMGIFGVGAYFYAML